MFELKGKELKKGALRERLSEFRENHMRGPMFAIIVMIAITEVLAVILYVLVNGG